VTGPDIDRLVEVVSYALKIHDPLPETTDAALAALSDLAARARQTDFAKESEAHWMRETDRLARRVAELEAALRGIEQNDELVEVNDAAFSIYAFRRCQQIARAALAGDGGFPKDRIMPTSGACAPNHYGDRPCGGFGDRCDCGDGGGA
jgi:hypothetical protein